MPSMEELQDQLTKQIEALDIERRKNAESFEKERKQLIEFAAMERAKQVEEYTKKVEEHARRQADKEAAEKERERQTTAARIATEQKQFEMDEALRLQRAKLSWLEEQISNAEFAEEQQRKDLETKRNMILRPVEQPADGSKLGEAAIGTEGTSQKETMSEHLKNILRQANRI